MGNLPKKSDGKYWAFTEVGSYPLVYICADGGELCAACASGEHGSEASETNDDSQWRLVAADIHWEGPPIHCAHCNAEIESAYGDPDDPS